MVHSKYKLSNGHLLKIMETTVKPTFKNIEIIEKLGGSVFKNYAIFKFDEEVSNDNRESITLQDAINVEKQMIDLGLDGALIGHPLDEGDSTYIYFESTSLSL